MQSDLTKTIWGTKETLHQINEDQVLSRLCVNGTTSLQVHPSDEYWIVTKTGEHSKIYIGFTQLITQEEINELIDTGKITDVLQEVEPRAGSCFHIPAGMAHGIVGDDLEILEIHSKEHTTYRLWDWGRERDLQAEYALDCIKNHGNEC